MPVIVVKIRNFDIAVFKVVAYVFKLSSLFRGILTKKKKKEKFLLASLFQNEEFHCLDIFKL